MIGKTVSHYKIIEKIGGGGMGEVYLADDLKLDRKVAIKFLPEHLTKDTENIERFEREAKAIAALNHPNIVTVYDIIEEDGLSLIVMEYVDGSSLREIIDKQELDKANVIDIITQISEGLQQAHNKGIVHRDIKPENIIVGKDGRVRILDFGLAKLKGVSKLTKETSTIGTIHYESPEQLQGKEVDHRSDIWSLGVLAYELLNGEVPFKGDYESAVHYAILNDEPDFFKANIPEALIHVLNKCLRKNPADRYQKIEELLNDIKDLNTPPSGKTKVSPQRKTIIYGSFVVVILAIVVLGYFLIPLIKSAESRKGEAKWENSIAVLPFSDLSPDKDQEWFCDGMTEQIITNLSKIKRLKVIGRTSIMKFKDTKKTLPEIGNELNVSHILEGSIRKYKDKIRVTAQLVNSGDGSHLWADDFDRTLNDVFEVQDDVSKAIASNLLVTLSPEEKENIKTNRTINTKAYEYYMRGRYFHLNRFLIATGSLDDFNKSEKLLKKAIELDPNYAPPYVELADLYNTYYNEKAQDEGEKIKYLDLQEKYINVAYNLDPNLAEVQQCMGWFLVAKGEIDKAYQSFKNALVIKPNEDWIYYSMAHFYVGRGLYHLAHKLYSKGIELNPLNASLYQQRSIPLIYLGELEKAEADLQKALEINPDNRGALYSYGQILIILNKLDKAEQIISRRERIYPEVISNLALRAWLFAAMGKKDKALEIDFIPGNKFYMYIFYLILKMKEESIDYLYEDFENIKQNQRSWYLGLINFPLHKFLHSDPRFQEILAKHKALYEENLRKYGDIDL